MEARINDCKTLFDPECEPADLQEGLNSIQSEIKSIVNQYIRA